MAVEGEYLRLAEAAAPERKPDQPVAPAEDPEPPAPVAPAEDPEPVEKPEPVAEDQGSGHRPDLLLWAHRALTLVAVMSLVVNTRGFWTSYALTRPGLALTLTGAYLAMLVAATLALCASRQRTLAALDVGVLVTAIAIKGVAAWSGISGVKEMTVDEGMLMDRASRALAEGINPYTSAWDDILPSLPTQLMDGRGVFDFGYPALGVEMGAGMQTLFPSIVGIAAVAWLALLATVLILFFAAPRPLRPLATVGVLGLGTLTGYADNAYPSLIALPFLCLALWRWPSIGKGGRLGRAGLGSAVALGLACAIHQLGWFLAMFLVVGLVMLRLGELPLIRVFWLLMRYGCTALAVFFLANLRLLLRAPEHWLTGVFEPMTQHAVPHGQGLMGITSYVIGGSGALDLYGHATKALLVALLVTFALYLRRLGPAIAVLPWLIFMVSTRSQDGYWVLTMPLWIVALATTSRADFAGAFRIDPPWPRPLVRTLATAGTVVLFLPAAALVTIAATTPQPLTMRVASTVVPGQRMTELVIDVTNESGRALVPSFTMAAGVTIGDFWVIRTGPLSLPAHTSATYTLVPPVKRTEDPVTPTIWVDSIRPAGPEPETFWRAPGDGPVFLRAVSDEPQTLSSVLVIPDRPDDHELDPA